jgi:hypothetical protein
VFLIIANIKNNQARAEDSSSLLPLSNAVTHQNNKEKIRHCAKQQSNPDKIYFLHNIIQEYGEISYGIEILAWIPDNLLLQIPCFNGLTRVNYIGNIIP